MNDIEAAFRKFKHAQACYGADCERNGGIASEGAVRDRDEAEDALLKALAHAARGEGVRCWRDAEGTLPARRDGDKVVRVDDVVPAFLDPIPPPATRDASNPGEKEER